MRNAGLSRVAVAAVAAAALWFVVDAGAWSVYPAYLAALLAAVYGLALSSGVRPPRYSAGSGLLVAVLDSALISLLVASTGGVDSPFSALYLLAAFAAGRGSGFAVSAAVPVAGYLSAAAVPAVASGALPGALPASAGLDVALILLAALLSSRLTSELEAVREETGAHAARLASEEVYAGRLEKALTSLGEPLGLLREEDVLRWAVETARETVGAAYVHAALPEGNLHRTAADGELTLCPSWWHPDVQRLVLWSYKTGGVIHEEPGPQGTDGMEGLVAVPITAGDGAAVGTLLAAGGDFGEGGERVLRRIAAETAGALRARGEAPGGADPVTRLPNRASLTRLLEREGRHEGRLTLLRAEVSGIELYRETHGNSAAEDLLRRIGGRLRAVQHRVFWAGAGDFVLLVSGNAARVRRAISSVQEAVAESAPSGAAQFSACVGVSRSRGTGERGFDPDKALEAARRALDRAKRAPGGVVYEEELGLGERELEESGTVQALVEAAEAHDPYLGDHLRSVSRLARSVGEQLGLSGSRLGELETGALLHDVGKIGLPQSLLAKPGPLSAAEYETMKLHPEIGVKILEPVEGLSCALPVVKHHHERYDGGGYPDGLTGERIPLGARITLVADALDSMTQDRTYRRGASVEAAVREISAGSGSQFDPGVVSALLALMGSGGEDGIRHTS